ncbi:MAG TPA: glycosyltransferase [Aeromicrobium sp.]|nr:glycosyltransferase [Aeromicrobium sp.]
MSAASGARPALGRAKRYASRHAPANPSEYPRARRLLNNGLFDPWYYQLQTGGSASPTRAAAHFLRAGAQQGLLANPLTDFLGTGLSADQIIDGLLDGSARVWPLRPLVSDSELTSSAPGGAVHRGGPAALYLQCAHAGAPVVPIDNQPWPTFVRARKRQSATLKRLLRSGLFDREYYELQTGTRFGSERAAAWHYLEIGEPTGIAPNRLFEPEWYRAKAHTSVKEVVAHYLRSPMTESWTGPHFHAPTYLTQVPQASEHPGGALGHFLTTTGGETYTVPRDGSHIRPVRWSVFASAVDAGAARFAEQAALIASPPVTIAEWALSAIAPTAGPANTEIVIVSDAQEWTSKVPRGLKTVRTQTHDAWTLKVAVTDGAPVPLGLATAAEEDSRICLVPTSAASPAERANDVIASIDAEWVAFWEPREAWSPNALSALLGGAAPGIGAQAAVKDTQKRPEIGCRVKPRTGDALLWDRPRSLAGTLLSTALLRRAPFRAEAEDQYGWDFLLRLQQELPFVPVVASEGPSISVSPVASNLRSPAEHVLRAERLLDWDDIARRERVGGRISMLMPTFEDWAMTREAVTAVLANSGDADVEVVVLDNGSRRAVTSILAGCFADDARVVIQRVPQNTNFATGSNLAFAASTGQTVIFLNNDTYVLPGWLPPLVEALGQPATIGAQPVLVYDDGTIQSAGTVFFGSQSIPGHFLTGHPVEDLPPLERMRFPAVTAACMALPAERVNAMRGFDPVFVNGVEDVDLCLRLRAAYGGDFAVRTDSRVIHHESKTPGRSRNIEPNRLRFLERWDGLLPGPEPERWAASGLEVIAHRADPGLQVTGHRTAVTPLIVRPKSIIQDGAAAGLPRLRWALKVAAHGGPRGDGWGDVAFANDLAHGLRELGQEAVIDRRLAHARPGSDHLDDVALHLRGLETALAQPGDITNVLWVISHPDLVADYELSPAFDLVYSAGRQWSSQASRRSGREVRTLLQATNTRRFRPDGPATPDLDVLFVGRTRGVYRPIVHDAIDVGASLTVYGDGWESFIDESYVKADHLPNAELPSAYRGARIVLNDHWADMAKLGFLSNRLFDAVACGTRVVTDPIEGVAEVFGEAVRVYNDVDELKPLLAPDSDAWSDDDAIAAAAHNVAVNHSFAARARTLLADVLDVRGVDHDLRSS